MRIIVVDKHGCQFPHLGHQIKSAFEQLGHEVKAFHYRYLHLEHIPFTNWLMNRRLIKLATGWPADFVLVFKGESLLPGTIDAIKKAGIKTANWSNDEPFGEILAFNKLSNIAEYDDFFIFDDMYMDRLLAINPDSHHLPPGADPFGVHKEQIPLAQRTFPADVCLVGTAYPARIEFLKNFSHRKLALAGPGWDKTDYARIARPPVSIIEMVRMFNESKVNLNPHNKGLMVPNVRFFEIPASKSFQLVNDRDEFTSFFVPKKEMVMYKDEAECKEMADYYIDHDEERTKITQAGYARIIKDHTIKHRLEKMLKILKLS